MFLALLFTWLHTALGAEVRLGVFVGNDFGGAGDQDLVFASSDARKMRDLFINYGGLRSGDAVLLENEARRSVLGAVQGLHRRIVEARNRGDHITLVFYYSGHGDDQALHLGPSNLAHDELRKVLEDSGADVRIAMLDACQSGAAVRDKGGSRGPAFDFAVDVAEVRGTAFLTSSAASELSQEGAEVGGGFFTHYLHSALLGAGDSNRDGEVTLHEAYDFVHGETVFGTRENERAQTPTRDFDIVGAGKITLTTLEAATSKLNLLGDMRGNFAIWDDQRKRYVAEVEGSKPLQLAVRPGTYYLHRRMHAWVDEARYEVRRGETRTIAIEDFVSVPYEDTASRGYLDRVVRRAKLPALSLRALIGVRTFGRGIVKDQYIPDHGALGIEARFLNGAGITYWSFDFLMGGGPGVLNFDELGPVNVGIQSYSGAASVGFATPPALIRAGTGGRAQVVGFTRTFPDGQSDAQGSITIAPGIQGWVGLHVGRFAIDIEHHLMFMALGFSEEDRHPSYSEFFISSGYRF